MIAKRAIIINETGVHARPAANLIGCAKQFTSKISIRNLSRENQPAVNAKSIVMVLSLAISKGMEVEIAAEGDDEQEAAAAIIDYIERGLGE